MKTPQKGFIAPLLLALIALLLIGGVSIFVWSQNQKPSPPSSLPSQLPPVPNVIQTPVGGGTPTPYVMGTTTSTFSNFSFSYPGRSAAGTGWDGVWCPGVHQVHSGYPENQDNLIAMATTSAPLCAIAFNPNAKTLADFEGGYSIANTFVERINSQSYVTTNGIRMLRQIYSQGRPQPDGTIDVTTEYSVDHQLRYVFFDGKSFVVITAQIGDGLDQFVQSIQLLNK